VSRCYRSPLPASKAGAAKSVLIWRTVLTITALPMSWIFDVGADGVVLHSNFDEV
jgi:hypothetical protein